MSEPKNRAMSADQVETPEKPKAKKSPPCQVRARCHLAEEIDGVIQRFEPGQEFTTTESRAAALGPLVAIIPQTKG